MKQPTTIKTSMLVIGMFAFLSGLAGNSITLALPQISHDLGISNSASTWVVQVGLITTTMFLIMFGHLGDLFSKQRVFLWGTILFTLGDLFSGFAPTFSILLISRIIQSIGSSMILANTLGLVSDLAPADRKGEMLSLVSVFMTLGAIGGPAIGGLILSIADWRWTFFFNVPIGAVFMFLGFRDFQLPKLDRQEFSKDLKQANWWGLLLSSAGLILVFYSTNFFQGAGNGRWLGVALLAVGTVILLYSFYQDSHAKNPWIAPEILKNPTFVLLLLMLMLFMLINVTSNLLLPFYLQSFLKQSAMTAGLIIVTQSFATAFLAPVAGWLADRMDRRPLIVLSFVILAVSQVGYYFYPDHLILWLIVLPIVINGIGMGFFVAPNNSLAMSVIPQKYSGIGGSLSSYFRTLGMTIGNSLGSTILFSQLPGVKTITPAIGKNFMSAFSNVFLVATLLSLLGLAIAVKVALGKVTYMAGASAKPRK